MNTARVQRSFHLCALLAAACASLLLARTLNTGVELALLPPPTLLARAPHQPPTATEPPTPLSAEQLARLTGLMLGDSAPREPGSLGEEPALPQARGLRLLGTAVSARQEKSFASLYEEASRRARTVWEGSQLQGLEVVAIERTRVLLRHEGRLEQLTLGSAPLAPPAPAAPTAALGGGIREVGPHAYSLPREELRRALEQPERLATEARILPVLGESGGFKVLGIRQDSLFARLGLRNGDAVQRINGLSLRSVENALEAWTRLREASHFELELVRDGQPVKKTYSVRD